MKKFLIAAILFAAFFIPAAISAEINHPDSIYYPHLDFYNVKIQCHSLKVARQ